MVPLTRLWRFWTESWQSARRARLLYGTVTLAFASLIIVAAVMHEPAVAVIAGVVTIATAGITIIAPRLTEWTSRQDVM